MSVLDEVGGKKIVLCRDEESGLRAVIAIHSTALGPAAGGLRFKPYDSADAAVRDAARLARAMTLKYAAAGMPMGGAKAVIIGDPKVTKTTEILRAFGRFVDEQAGEYWVGEDVGTNGEDMEVLARETSWLVSLPKSAGGPGDVSITTALGVLRAIRACSIRAFGEDRLATRSAAVQGLGQVGMKLARLLAEEGVHLIVADPDETKTQSARDELGAEVVPVDAITTQAVDILAPCALGDAINVDNKDRIRARVVAGSANNVFSEERIADELEERGIVYAVDYIANAGGLVYDDQMMQRPRPQHFDETRAMAYVDAIFDRTMKVFEIAEERRLPLRRAALSLAEDELSRAAGGEARSAYE